MAHAHSRDLDRFRALDLSFPPVSDGMGDFAIGSGRVLVGGTFGTVRVRTSWNIS